MSSSSNFLPTGGRRPQDQDQDDPKSYPKHHSFFDVPARAVVRLPSEPVSRAGVGEVMRNPASRSELNLCSTVGLLTMALLQAEDSSSCPCCGEDWPGNGGTHHPQCTWPTLVRLGYVSSHALPAPKARPAGEPCARCGGAGHVGGCRVCGVAAPDPELATLEADVAQVADRLDS